MVSAYAALLHFARFDVKVDQLAILASDLLALWPPIVVEPSCLGRIDQTTLLTAVELIGEAGAPLAQYARTADHSLHLLRWLRRLGATVHEGSPPVSHLARDRVLLAVVRALRRIYVASCDSKSTLAVTQAGEITSLLALLREHFDADPAVLAREKLERIHLYL